MKEETPFNPCSKKGNVRAQITTSLLNEIKAGQLSALIAPQADFYVSDAKTSVANILVLEKFAKGAKALWLVTDSVPHSYTFTSDAARSLTILAATESAWNQTWHVPTTANPPIGTQFIEMAAKKFRGAPKYRV